MKQKSKARKIFMGVMAVLFIVGLSACSSDDKEKDPVEDKPQTENKEVTYRVGEVVKVGDVEYTVNNTETTKTIGDTYLNTSAQEMFLKVNVTIKNNGNKALSVSDSFFKLKKGDKEFDTDSGSSMYLSDESIVFKSINPDATLTGSILFDVTQETIDDATLQLQVQTGIWGSEKGFIQLN